MTRKKQRNDSTSLSSGSGSNIIADRHLDVVLVRRADQPTVETPHLLQVSYAAEGSGCRLMIEVDFGTTLSLAEVLATRPTLRVEESIALLTEVSAALQESEALGLHFCDLHPSTIGLDAGVAWTPLVADRLATHHQKPHGRQVAGSCSAAADFGLRQASPSVRRSREFASLARRVPCGADEMTAALSPNGPVQRWIDGFFAKLLSGEPVDTSLRSSFGQPSACVPTPFRPRNPGG